LKKLSIHAYLCYDGYKTGSNDPIPCEERVKQEIKGFLGLPALTDLSLCKYDYRADSSLEGTKAMIMGGDLRSLATQSQT
jgi:hypothetical protein